MKYRCNWTAGTGVWNIQTEDGSQVATGLKEVHIDGPSLLANTAFPPKGYCWCEGDLTLYDGGTKARIKIVDP